MVRTDDDSWDVTEGVGQTALGVAMARAEETTTECPLFTDRYSQMSTLGIESSISRRHA